MRERSPFAHTLYPGCTNGGVDYIPMTAAYPEAARSKAPTTSPAAVAPNSAGRVVDTSVGLPEDLMQS